MRLVVAGDDTFGLPVFCIGEFWRAVTREMDDRRVAPAEAAEFLSEWLTTEGTLLLPAERYLEIFFDLVRRLRPSSNGGFDVQVLAVAIEAGAEELWTFDADDRRHPFSIPT